VALLAHEFSHKVGFNEKKAEELQEYLLYAFEEYGIDARTPDFRATFLGKNNLLSIINNNSVFSSKKSLQ
jgi:hypothetical protein